MRFPGSRPLHEWDLSVHRLSFDDLVRSCRQVGLTGLAEIGLSGGAGLIFYYLGGEVNAHFREASAAYTGQAALDRMRSEMEADSGVVSVCELPLDMSHLLRGITNRQPLREILRCRADLVDLLRRLEKAEHTGTLEIETAGGAGMVLLVRGRVSNTYWERSGGPTYEKGAGRQELEEALERAEAVGHLSEFSREVWKARHAVQFALRSRLERRGEEIGPAVAAEETRLRREVLDRLAAEVPSLLQAFVFDLMTGMVLARTGRGAEDVRVGAMGEQLPPLTIYVRDGVLGGADENALEHLTLSTAHASILVATVPEVQEAIAVVADRSEPAPLVGAALTRAVGEYAAALHPAGKAIAWPAAAG